MHDTMRKPRTVPSNRYVERPAKLNNYLKCLPGLNKSNNMDEAELNNILLHATPNGWSNQSYLQG